MIGREQSQSLLSGYNSLTDKHLSGYFANTRMRKHLIKSGLVSKNGHVTSERLYRLKMAKKEHQQHMQSFLATAIVEKALDMERLRQHEIRKRLDELYKIELVNKVKGGRGQNYRGDELIAILSPRRKSSKSRSSSAHVLKKDKWEKKLTEVDSSKKLLYDRERNHDSLVRSFKPHPPASTKCLVRRKKQKSVTPHKSHQLIAHRIQLQSMAEVTMKFHGQFLNLAGDVLSINKLSEVQVIQQHCGGNTVCIFRELLPANTLFTFVSRRHRGSPLGLTININGIRNIQLSSCCEYKHTPGSKIGGKKSQFSLVSVQGAAPCYRCQVRLQFAQPPRVQERETSSDEEEATKSFDVIVSGSLHKSNAENEEEEYFRPNSACAHATTQTKEDEYQSETFEAEGKEDSSSEKEEDVSSESLTESEEEHAIVKITAEDERAFEASRQSSESDRGSDSGGSDVDVQEDRVEEEVKKDSGISDSEEEEEIVVQKDEGSSESSENSGDDEADPSSEDEKSDDAEEKKQAHEKESEVVEDVLSSEDENETDVSGKEMNDFTSENESYKTTEEETVNQLSKNKEPDSDGSDSSTDSTENNKEANEESKLDSSECDDDVESSSDEANDKTVHITSAISRESTMLTGNEDGRCESANKTIQFNEEVDVVHFAKNDANPELTASSDVENEDDDDFELSSKIDTMLLADLCSEENESTAELTPISDENTPQTDESS